MQLRWCPVNRRDAEAARGIERAEQSSKLRGCRGCSSVTFLIDRYLRPLDHSPCSPWHYHNRPDDSETRNFPYWPILSHWYQWPYRQNAASSCPIIISYQPDRVWWKVLRELSNMYTVCIVYERWMFSKSFKCSPVLAGKDSRLRMCTITVALTIGETTWCPSPSALTERMMCTSLLTATPTPTPDCSTTWTAWSAGTWTTCRESSWGSVWWVSVCVRSCMHIHVCVCVVVCHLSLIIPFSTEYQRAPSPGPAVLCFTFSCYQCDCSTLCDCSLREDRSSVLDCARRCGVVWRLGEPAIVCFSVSLCVVPVQRCTLVALWGRTLLPVIRRALSSHWNRHRIIHTACSTGCSYQIIVGEKLIRNAYYYYFCIIIIFFLHLSRRASCKGQWWKCIY